MNHICAACQRRRSSFYHDRYPLAPGKVPKPGVCSRCVKKHFLNQSPPTVIVEDQRQQPNEVHHCHHYEFHHYHHSCPCESAESIPIAEERPVLCAELPSETSHRQSQNWAQDRSPPPVYPGSKPTLPAGY